MPDYNPYRKEKELTDYSTSFKGVSRVSKNMKPFDPRYIDRDQIRFDEDRIPQYRSVQWGDRKYKSWRDIDPLDQPAAYMKPSFKQTLIEPDIVVNQASNEPYRSLYGGHGGTMRRSEGVNYDQRIFKHTPSNGYRRDTKSMQYEHSEETFTDKYRAPREYQLYPDYSDTRKVLDVKPGVKIVGEQAPLSYPEYSNVTV
jgi:hypothetical protein